MKTLVILSALLFQSGIFQYVCLEQDSTRIRFETTTELHIGDTIVVDSFLSIVSIKPKLITRSKVPDNMDEPIAAPSIPSIEIIGIEDGDYQLPNRQVEALDRVDIRAEYPGGESAFRDYVKFEFQYPDRCRDMRIDGRVKLRFIVDNTGRISNIQVLEETKSCPEFTQEAIRVLASSKRWIPAQVNGRFTTSWRELPIVLPAE